ncbi:DUF1045 domain-containing protein [Devosia nitrariae]|uniref:DUF1045 domain-containing protein n=1 Tax=Devosia nitrariae TaxID=2071872 RepID=A0ABQ5W708_9HYPH|nr:DUF1045 domain-containing protein [Devosia nitrariae]GLQ55657.1 hypothetical protein GCM10010862_29160 [Devosia nitrariae]
MRCAIYFIPARNNPLTVAATRWLGRDAYTGERVKSGGVEGLIEEDRAFLTAPVRRFGFHGTLRAPFQLVEGFSIEALARALARFTRQRPSLLIPRTDIRLLDSFFCLLPDAPSPEVNALAAEVVMSFDHFRAPMSEGELERRYPLRLTDRQHANLLAWGHPFVLDDYRFHMSLTGPVPQNEQTYVLTVLKRYFGTLTSAPLLIDQLALFYEPEPNAPMCIHSVHRLAELRALRSA